MKETDTRCDLCRNINCIEVGKGRFVESRMSVVYLEQKIEGCNVRRDILENQQKPKEK